MSKHKVFFNAEKHRYYDEVGTVFTSVTTVIGKYYEKFDTQDMARRCADIGTQPSHPKYARYAGKTQQQLLNEWAATSKKATDTGTAKHNWLEEAIKACTQFEGHTEDERLFTAEDITNNGTLDVPLFLTTAAAKYPQVCEFVAELANQGFRFFAEICVFSLEYGVSGLIDLLAVNDKGEFIIIDWKTNKADIRYDSGYFAKDDDGQLTNRFVLTDKHMLEPLGALNDSVGTKYNLQISTYAWLLEKFGYQNLKDKNVIFQIRAAPEGETLEQVNLIRLQNYSRNAGAMIKHHAEAQIE